MRRAGIFPDIVISNEQSNSQNQNEEESITEKGLPKIDFSNNPKANLQLPASNETSNYKDIIIPISNGEGQGSLECKDDKKDTVSEPSKGIERIDITTEDDNQREVVRVDDKQKSIVKDVDKPKIALNVTERPKRVIKKPDRLNL